MRVIGEQQVTFGIVFLCKSSVLVECLCDQANILRCSWNVLESSLTQGRREMYSEKCIHVLLWPYTFLVKYVCQMLGKCIGKDS